MGLKQHCVNAKQRITNYPRALLHDKYSKLFLRSNYWPKHTGSIWSIKFRTSVFSEPISPILDAEAGVEVTKDFNNGLQLKSFAVELVATGIEHIDGVVETF